MIGNDELQKNKSPLKQQLKKTPANDNLYDMVKIKVRLGQEHYFIFSRFLISRMLTLCRVRKLDAIQIAKAIKKKLIEGNQMELTQLEFFKTIFDTMKKFGYENSIPKYEMVNKFYSKRTPMIILIFGAPCIGKSLIANNLAERLNVSNVLQTNIVQIVMQGLDETFSKKLKDIDDIQDNDEELIQRFKNNCRIIRQGVSMDIQKCLSEGKPVIIEGINVMPELYIAEENDVKKNIDFEQLQIDQLINDYINNTIKLRKHQRKDINLFNIKNQVNRKWKIIYPEPMESEDENDIKREIKYIKELEKIVKNYTIQDFYVKFRIRMNH